MSDEQGRPSPTVPSGTGRDPGARDQAQIATRPSGQGGLLGMAPGLRLCLSVFQGPDSGTKLEVRTTRLIIGRGEADFCLGDPSVSAEHCVLEISGAEVDIRDLETPEGTRVNGVRISRAALHDGDEIGVGSTAILFTALPVQEAGEPRRRIEQDEEYHETPALDPTPSATVLDGSSFQEKLGVVRRDTALYLEVMVGQDAGRIFDLSRPGTYLIGRQKGEIPLSDEKCSGKHAQIRILGQGEYYLSDLASTNGTFLNEVRTVRRRLKHMDIVRVGGTHLRFSCLEESIPVTE